MTKKQMISRIAQLERELESEKHKTRHSALISSANLPKCKNVACYNCKYVTFPYHPTASAVYLLGCGKELAQGGCQDYEHTDENKPNLSLRYAYLQSMEEAYWQNPRICPGDLREHSPQMPSREAEAYGKGR